MTRQPKSYAGNKPYAFVCYAHADSDQVLPLIDGLQQAGNNIWYDEHISPGSSWTDELARAIEGCSHFLLFVSPQSVESRYCLDEINFALEHDVKIIVVHIVETEMPSGLKLSLNRRQAIMASNLPLEVRVAKIADALTSADNIDSASYPVTSVRGAVRTRSRSSIFATVAATMAVLIAVGIYFQFFAPGDERAPSVLLLPFEDLGLTDELRYLPASLNNDLIGRLALTPDLKVIAPLSARKYANSDQSIQQMAESSNVAHVLTGTIQTSGETILVTAQLTNLDNSVVWSDQVQGTVDRLIELQAELVANIARGLSLQLDDELRQMMLSSGTANVEAFDLMLRNMELTSSRATDRMTSILSNSKRAVDLDPSYVSAWASLAITSQINMFVNGVKSDALTYAETAYQLDPTHPRALRAMGFVHMATDPELALTYLDKAVAAMPQNSLMYTDRAIALRNARRYAAAEADLSLALELDPLNEIARGNLVDTLLAQNKTEEARAQAELGVELQPNNPNARLTLAEVLANAADPFDSLVESVRALESNTMVRAELSLVRKLIQLDQLDAAKAWQAFFMQRNSNERMSFMVGRIAKSSADLATYNAWLNSMPTSSVPVVSLPLQAMQVMLQADITSDNAGRMVLHQQALENYAIREAMQAFGAFPISDLGLFSALTRRYVDPAAAAKLNARLQAIPDVPTFATEHAMPVILSGDSEAALAQIEELASAGLLNLPLLREMGMAGENRVLYEFTQNPRFDKAMSAQSKINEALRTRARAEFPKLLSAPTQ